MLLRSHLIKSLLLALCAPLAGMAQAEAPELLLDVEWRAISIGQTIRDLHYRAETESLQRVFIPNGALSSTYEYKGPAPMQFYREGEPPVPVASVAMRPETKEALIFIRSTGSDVQAQAIPMALDALNNGHSRLVNLTRTRIAGFHSGTKFQLAPMESSILPFDTPENQGVIKVSIQVASAGEEGWQPNINSSFGVTSDMCVNLLFVPAQNGDVEMIPLRERKRRPEPAETTQR